eukprot:gene2938-4615_t
MSHLQFNEPPPLLNTEYGRMPFETLAINHVAGRHDKKGGMKKHELQSLMDTAMHELAVKARKCDSEVEHLDKRFRCLIEVSRNDKETLRLKMNEVSDRLNAISEAIDYSLVFLPKVKQAAENLQRAQFIRDEPDAVLRHCTAAKSTLENLPRGGLLAPGQRLPDDVISLLTEFNRGGVVLREVQPTSALLALCYNFMGDAYRNKAKYDEAASSYFEALELIKEEEGADHPAAQELVKSHHQCMQYKLDASPVEPPAPSTPPSSSRRFIPFTPPAARSVLDLDSEFARGAVTPGTGPSWDSVTPNYFGFARPWLPEATPSPTPPTRPKIIRECYHCGSAQNLKLCSKCKKVCFCSVDCQTQAWEDKHSEECQDYRQTAGTTTA